LSPRTPSATNAQHSDGIEHRFLFAVADAHDDHLAGFLSGPGSAESAERLVVRHRVSLTFSLPGFYREKIRGCREL